MVYYTFSAKVRAVILRKRSVVHNDAVLLLHTSNLCAEFILVGNRCIPINLYVKAFFTSECVSRYLAKVATSLVLNNTE